MVALMFVLFLIVVLGGSWVTIKTIKRRQERKLTREIEQSLAPSIVAAPQTNARAPLKMRYAPAFSKALPIAYKLGLAANAKPVLPYDSLTQVVAVEDETIDIGALHSALQQFIATWAEFVKAAPQFTKPNHLKAATEAKIQSFRLTDDIDGMVKWLLDAHTTLIAASNQKALAVSITAPVAQRFLKERAALTESLDRVKALSSMFVVPQNIELLNARLETCVDLAQEDAKLAEQIQTCKQTSADQPPFVEQVGDDGDQAVLAQDLTEALHNRLSRYCELTAAAQTYEQAHNKANAISRPEVQLPNAPDQTQALKLISELESYVCQVLACQETEDIEYQRFRQAGQAYDRSAPQETFVIAGGPCTALRAVFAACETLEDTLYRTVQSMYRSSPNHQPSHVFIQPGSEPKDENNVIQALKGQTKTLALAMGARALAERKYYNRRNPNGNRLPFLNAKSELSEIQILEMLDSWSDQRDKLAADDRRLMDAYEERCNQRHQAQEKLKRTTTSTANRPALSRDLHIAQKTALELLALNSKR